MDVAALQQFADSTWRTCSPTRSRRTERPSGVSTLRIGCTAKSHPEQLTASGALLDLEHFEIVARLDVVGVGQEHAAFEAGADLGDVVLEAAQRGDRRLGDDDVLAGEAGVEALADDAFEDQQAGGLVLACRPGRLP